MPPKVSVIMPVYNGERYLAEAISSILWQTYSDFEFIIVDDASTDSSPEIIREYAKRDSRIRSSTLNENGGQGRARNHGIAQANAEYIAAMDNDDIAFPERLRLQVQYLDANPDIGVIGGNMCAVDQNLKILSTSNLPQAHAQIAWALIMDWAMVGPLAMMRRSKLLVAGGYDNSRTLSDDLNLWSRMIEETRFANLPEILYLHRRHPQSSSVKEMARLQADGNATRRRMLERVWEDIPNATVKRFQKARRREQFKRRAQRRLLRADLEQLIERLVAAGWIQPDERPLMRDSMLQLLEQIFPRARHFWQHLI